MGRGERDLNGYLRRATESDMELLFEWANEQQVRENSFSTRKITYEEHQAWFRRLLNSEDCQQYIYMNGDEAIGQIRVTVYENTAEIGYSICKEKRQQGYGKAILRLICEQMRRDFPEVQKLSGKVKSNNMASRNAFLDTGFEEKYSVYEIAVHDCKENGFHDINQSFLSNTKKEVHPCDLH